MPLNNCIVIDMLSFDEIYNVTKTASDIETLKAKLNGCNIDHQTEGYCITVAAKLAFEGEIEKVDWLRKLGANKHNIALGFAKGSHNKEVKRYYNRHDADPNFCILGYAMAGNHYAVNKWQAMPGTSSLWAALGYAVGGYHEKVENLKKAYYKNWEDSMGLVSLSKWHRDLYHDLIKKIIFGYVIAGEHSRVDEYNPVFSEYIAYCYAKLGDDEHVEICRKQLKVEPIAIISGYTEGEAKDKAKEFSKKALILLLDEYIEERKAKKDSSGKTREYINGSFFSFFQKSFTEKKNAVLALKEALKGNNIDLTAHLAVLRNGQLGQKLRTFIKSKAANILIDQQISTVRELVSMIQLKADTCLKLKKE